MEEFVDIIEAGTPLIKYEGMRAVRLLRQSFPHKIIMADLKIADVGALETKMAHEAGADMLSCLGTAPFETILETIETAKKYKMKVGIDTIGISDLKKGLLRIEKTKPDFLVIHCGIDEQKRGKDPISSAKLASKITKIPLASVARNSDLVIKISNSVSPKSKEDYLVRQLAGEDIKHYAPLGTLFELSTLVFLERLVALLIERKKIDEKKMRAQHANLE